MTLDYSTDAVMPAHQDSKMWFMKKTFLKILAPYYRKQLIHNFRGTVLLKLVLFGIHYDYTKLNFPCSHYNYSVLFNSVLKESWITFIEQKHLHRLNS